MGFIFVLVCLGFFLGRPVGASVGKFVFATKSPFSIVENKEFLSMMQFIRPGIKLPGRQVIAGRILNDVYDEEWQKFEDAMKDKLVTLAIDGWSTLTNEPSWYHY